jgi:hypothetical protein
MTPGASLYHLPLPRLRIALGNERVALEGFAAGIGHDTYGRRVASIVRNDTFPTGDPQTSFPVMSSRNYCDRYHSCQKFEIKRCGF